jgi:hypothetical protein
MTSNFADNSINIAYNFDISEFDVYSSDAFSNAIKLHRNNSYLYYRIVIILRKIRTSKSV